MLKIALRSASSSSKRILPALASIETLIRNPFYHQQSSYPSSVFPRNGALDGEFVSFSRIRRFHVKPERLDFRASFVSQAECAIDEDAFCGYEDEKVDGSGKGDAGLEISKLGIDHDIISALAKRGITKLFPIQRAVLEPAMEGRDMIGRARTGTGKTLAFGIPIMDKITQFNLKHGRGRNPLALVLAPTRELGRQVAKEFSESAPKLDTVCVYGGTPIYQQIQDLGHGVDIVVGTPGRIIDLIKRGALNLSEVQFLVIDEADQMLAVGFEEAVEMILEKLPQKRQSLMFSATMPSWIQNLTRKYLKNPLTIDLVGDSDQKLAEGISLYSISADSYSKASIIGPLITEHAKGGKCIIFTQTKRDADRLSFAVGRSIKCEALHGDIPQNRRERTLSSFRDGSFNVLVATDVASRGLDIPNVDLVIHYELPNSSEIFVHRSGRTGRAGRKGTAIVIYTDQQSRNVKLIEREVGCKFKELPRIAVEGGSSNIFADMGGSSSQFGSYGGGSGGRGFGNSGFVRSGGQGGYGYSRSGGGYGNSSSSRSGGFGGGGGRSGNFSGFGNSVSDRSGGFVDNKSSRTSGGGFGDSQSSRFSGFGDFTKDRKSF